MKITHRSLIPLFVLILLALGAVGVASAQNYTDIAGTVRNAVSPHSTSGTEISGTITSITPESWTVDGTEFSVLPQTEVKGAFVVGDVVQVHLFTASDGTLTASEIEFAETGVANDNGNDNGEIEDDNSNANSNDNEEIDDDNSNANSYDNEEIDDDSGEIEDDHSIINSNDNGEIDDDNGNANSNDNGGISDDDNSNANDNNSNDDSSDDHDGDDSGDDDHGGDHHSGDDHGDDDHGGDNGNDSWDD
jgi:hypothetical protein